MSTQSTPLSKQKTSVGSMVIVDGSNFISLGQVMWPVGPAKLCVADLLIDAEKMEKDVEIRDIKACLRIVNTAPPAQVAQLNRAEKRATAKKKKKN